jgi:hypothetical protein
MEEQNQIKRFLWIKFRDLELWLEKHSAIYILISVIFVGFAVLADFVDIKTNLFQNWKHSYTDILLILFIVAFLLLDFKHVRMLNNRMVEILRRDTHIRSQQKAMAEQTSRIEVPYVNESLHFTYEINENGDGVCARESYLTAINVPVYLFTILIGATSDSPSLLDYSILEIIVTGKNREQETLVPLLHYPVNDEPRNKRACVVLEHPVKVNEPPVYVKTIYKWPNLWKSLVDSFEDNGSIKVEHFTKLLALTIKSPPNFEFTSFTIYPECGRREIRPEGSRSIIVWQCENVQAESFFEYKIWMRQIN